MGLNLLSPWALLLIAGVGLPVLAHLARQVPRGRRAYGAMLLLERVVKRLRRRRRVKDVLLLAVRVLAVLSLALAAAGPEITYPGAPAEFGGSGRVVLVVDRSLSMSQLQGGDTLLRTARERATEVVQGLPEGVLIGLVVFDDSATRLTSSLTQDKGRVVSALSALQPSSGGSDLRDGLLEARRLLEGVPGEVLLFSDEAGPRMVGDARSQLELLVATGSSVVPQRVRPHEARNVSVVRASYGDGLEGGQVTVRVVNYGEQAVEVPCTVTLPDGADIPIFVEVPPQGEAEERVTVPTEASGGVGQVLCEDADLPLDDSHFFHLPRVGASRVLVVDGDPGDTPIRSEVYFLERALAPWGGLKSGVDLDVITPVGLMNLSAEEHKVVFLANVADPRPFGARLSEFVRQGGSVVISAGDNITAERYNAALAGLLPAPIRKARTVAAQGEPGLPLVMPGGEHPLFSPFRRAGREGFVRVGAHTVLTLEPYAETDDVQTLLRWEGGLPALVERRIGAGRVLLWTSTMDLGWSDLALQAVFMPTMQRLVGWLGGEAAQGAARFDATVGQQVAVPLPDLVMEPEVVGANGEVLASRIEGSRLLFTPRLPGAYALRLEDAPPLAWVAVNTDPAESDVRWVDSVAAAERELDPEALVQRADLSWPLLAVVALLFLLQAAWATREAT